MLLAGVFSSRLVFAFLIWKISGPPGFFTPDSPGYLALAQTLLHGSFSDDGLPNIVRTPGYPLLLVPAVAFQHPVLIAVFENLLLAVGSAWLIWRIVANLFPGSQASTWAVLLYCFEPVGFLYSVKVMPETLFCAQLLLFIWLVVHFFREPSYAKLLLAALALGCATYTRPVSIYLGVWLIPLFLLFPRPLPFIQRSFRAILFLVVFVLTLAPWTFRNVKVAEYRGFSSITDNALYFYSAAAIQAKLEHKSFAQEQEEMGFWDSQRYFQAHPEQSTWSRSQISRFMRAESERIISQHLPSYLFLHARGFVTLLFDTVATVTLQAVQLYPERGGLLARTVDQGYYRGVMWLIRQHPIVGMVFLLLGIQLLLYYVLALLGVRQLPFAVGCFFGFVVLYFVLVSGGPIASGRYRAPIMPLVCVPAGVAIASRRAARAGRQIAGSEAVTD
jgi:4-amino-4-deoxy-L-arabinose transferase-like glycosyltransferase